MVVDVHRGEDGSVNAARRGHAGPGVEFEDDYDGEFRYDVRGLPALHSQAQGHDVVAYLGTASKILSPGLRIAWLIARPDLRPAVRQALATTDGTISATTGQALTYYIASGHLTRHLARAARTAARRRALITALRAAAPEPLPPSSPSTPCASSTTESTTARRNRKGSPGRMRRPANQGGAITGSQHSAEMPLAFRLPPGPRRTRQPQAWR